MRQAYKFIVLILVASSAVLSSCYTQVASDGGGYYGYGRRAYRVRSVAEMSDTVYSAQGQPKTAMRYDTTMKGDTMFIEEHPATSAIPNESAPSAGNEEVINNYYDDVNAWPYYWPPSHAFAISFGWPYGGWYDPWYGSYYGWDNWGYTGFYPPVYDPYYAFYGGGFGRGFYGRGFYGHGFYGGEGRRFAYGNGGYPYSSIGRGSAGLGEGRSLTLGPSRGINSSVAMQGNRGFANGQSGLSSPIGRNSVGESRLSEVSGDRNSPVHAVGPDGGASTSAMARGESANSTASSHPIVVRRSADGAMSTTSSARANVGGRSVVVVRRSASSGQSSRRYGPSGRSNGGYRSSGSRGSYGGGSSSGRSSGGNSSSGSSGSRGGGSSSSGGGGRGGR